MLSKQLKLSREPVTQKMKPISQPLVMVDPTILMKEINERFVVNKQDSWVWYREPPSLATLQPSRGSAFSIEALSLIPKI